MPGTLKIENLKGIKSLEFNIPDRGITLLTGSNSSGKTSLLACLRRIGDRNAFPIHFPNSNQSKKLDNHEKGKITYTVNGISAEYAYRGKRWTPQPRVHANIFSKMGYSSVVYIGTNPERITPKSEDFGVTKVKEATIYVKENSNKIFDTSKFNGLKTVKISKSNESETFILELDSKHKTYHSEKFFSLGELCVLKLLRTIENIPNNSMLIIDELEIALHPKAQTRLLKLLEEESKNKSLTIIFSTHSVTLLKSANYKQIVYLEKRSDGVTTPVYGCYPTYAIGNIASSEEQLPDRIVYTEDVYAKEMVDSFFSLCRKIKHPDSKLAPSIHVIPIGGYKEVVTFLKKNKSILPNYIKSFAFLDEDVKSESIIELEKNKSYRELLKIDDVKESMKYLPFTPEVGLVDFIYNNKALFQEELRQRISDHSLHIDECLTQYDSSLSGAKRREMAKKVSYELLSIVERKTQKEMSYAREKICQTFAHLTWDNQKGHFLALYGLVS